MVQDVKYFISQTGDGFQAVYQGQTIGEITFARVGSDKIIIDYTGVAPEFQHQNIGLTLVRNVANMARVQKKHILALCPFARAMFNRYSEFDDVRLMRVH